MIKKLIHTFIILNIIFFSVNSYSLAIKSNKECQQRCGKIYECGKDSVRLKSSGCVCPTDHPSSLICKSI